MEQIAKKVTIENRVIVDLSSTTLQASEAKAGKRFYDANGNLTTGTYTAPAVQIDTNNEFTAGTSQTSNNATTGKYFSSVKINPTPTEEKVVSPSINSQVVLPQSNYHLSKVTINPIQIDTNNEFTAGTSEITQNAAPGKYFSSVKINPILIEEKVVSPSTTSQTVSPQSNYYLSKVTINPILTETKEIVPTTATASIQPTTGRFLSEVTVKPLQTKTINNFLNNQIITADEGYCGLYSVSITGTQAEFDAINAIIGEGI